MTHHETSIRIEEPTHKIIKKEIIPKSANYTSVKEFVENAIRGHVEEILSLAKGGEILRQLIRLLKDVEGLKESIPSGPERTTLGKGDLTKQVFIKLSVRTFGLVNDIEDETGLNSSEVYRICIFRRLYSYSSQPISILRYEWQEDLLNQVWADIKNGFISLKSMFHEILYRRFTLLRDGTLAAIRTDLHKFERFAEVYYEEFYESECYTRIRELYGERALNCAENVIEEVTDYTFTREGNDGQFLEELIEGE